VANQVFADINLCPHCCDQREVVKGVLIKAWMRQLVDECGTVLDIQVFIELSVLKDRRLWQSPSGRESPLALEELAAIDSVVSRCVSGS
jgi:hypothetical protein